MEESSQKPENSANKNAKSFGGYHVLETLGKGSFGKVKLVQSVASNVKYAMKIINKKNLNERAVQKIAREIRILSLLDHPHIVKLHDVFESNRHICIVTEYIAGGELFDYILVHHRVKEREAKRFFRHVAEGVHYCHSKNVIHRDLKPENLLLTSPDHTIKIIDFGLSNIFQTNAQLLKSQCGSPHYTAPEVTLGKEGYGTQADIFSMGVILFALVCGYLPFDDPNHEKILQDMRAERYTVPPFVSDEAADLISIMLRADSRKRATVEDILQHSWLIQSPPSSSPPSSSLKPVHPKRHIIAPLPDSLVSTVTNLPKKTSKDLLDELLKTENEKIKPNKKIEEVQEEEEEEKVEIVSTKPEAVDEENEKDQAESDKFHLPTVPEEPEKEELEAQELYYDELDPPHRERDVIDNDSESTQSKKSVGFNSDGQDSISGSATSLPDGIQEMAISPQRRRVMNESGTRRRSRAHTEEPGAFSPLRMQSEPKLISGKKPPMTPTRAGLMSKLSRLLGGNRDSISDPLLSPKKTTRKNRLSERRDVPINPVAIEKGRNEKVNSDPHLAEKAAAWGMGSISQPDSPQSGRTRMASAGFIGSKTPGPARTSRRLFGNDPVEELRTPQPVRRNRSRRNTDLKRNNEEVMSPTGSGPSHYESGAFDTRSATSTLSPKEIAARVQSTLELHGISFKKLSPFRFKCRANIAGQILRFTLEVFKLPQLPLHVVVYARKEGDIWEHKDVCQKILQSLQL